MLHSCFFFHPLHHDIQRKSNVSDLAVVLGLFSMSLWVEGDTYHAFGNSPTRRVPVPTLPTKNLPANPHYLVILPILFRGQEHGKEASTQVPKETLFNETKAWQIPMRGTGEGTAGQELSPVAFSRLIATLIRWNLIRGRPIRATNRKNCTA